jgi:formylglycine-generating enzyme required for sulfatase activity
MGHILEALWVGLALAALCAGCDHAAADADDAGGDTDVDSDTDSDTDTDTDADTDTETDTWPEFESDCHEETVNGLVVRWCAVPEGTFRMGCPSEIVSNGACGPDSHEIHDVVLSAYEIMDREVTVEMFRACVEAGQASSTPCLGTNRAITRT